LCGAWVHFLGRLWRSRRAVGAPTAGPTAGIVLGSAAALAAGVVLRRGIIPQRAALARAPGSPLPRGNGGHTPLTLLRRPRGKARGQAVVRLGPRHLRRCVPDL